MSPLSPRSPEHLQTHTIAFFVKRIEKILMQIIFSRTYFCPRRAGLKDCASIYTMHKVTINKQYVAYKRSPNTKELLSPKSPLPGHHLSQREVLGSALPKFFSDLKLVLAYTRTVSFPRPTFELAENTSSTTKCPSFHLFLIGYCELHGTKYFCWLSTTKLQAMLNHMFFKTH